MHRRAFSDQQRDRLWRSRAGDDAAAKNPSRGGACQGACIIRPKPNAWCSCSWAVRPAISTCGTTSRCWKSITARSPTLANMSKRFRTDLGPWMKSPFKFSPHGETGKMISEVVEPLGECVDDIAFVHNMVGKTGVHSQATYLQATGFQRPGFPGMGSWISYGLGAINENLPTFVVLARSSWFRQQRTEELGFRVPAGQFAGHGDLSAARESDRRFDCPRADYVTRGG